MSEYRSRYFTKELYDEDFLLEAANIDKESIANIDNSIQVKNASAKCIRTFKTLTYEMEKVVDVLIQLIAQKNNKSPDLKSLNRFKNDLEDLKKYSMEELTVDNFQIDIKDTYKKIGAALKDFSKIVIYTAERNECDKIGKTMRRIPKLTIDCFSAVNDYFKVNLYNGESLKNKAEKAKNSIKNKKKALAETLIAINNIYTMPISEADKDSYFESIAKGAEGMGLGIWNVITNPLGKLSAACNDLTTNIENLGKAWNTAGGDAAKTDATPGSTRTFIQVKYFMESPEFAKTLGGIAVAAGVIYLLRKAFQRIKRVFQ